MNNLMLLFTTLLSLLLVACNSDSLASEQVTTSKQNAKGLPVFIQIFKEEGILELYVKYQSRFQLLNKYKICKFSGGLGPKQLQGDLKSPEGFYQATLNGLNPNSRFHKSINIGYPNNYDRAHGYSGNYLMVHGKCESVGCYAMTNGYIEEIYAFAEAALRNGQPSVPINIYPFRMTTHNMQRHRNSPHITFWRQLRPGYEYFVDKGHPPEVQVTNGRYVINKLMLSIPSPSKYTFTKVK